MDRVVMIRDRSDTDKHVRMGSRAFVYFRTQLFYLQLCVRLYIFMRMVCACVRANHAPTHHIVCGTNVLLSISIYIYKSVFKLVTSRCRYRQGYIAVHLKVLNGAPDSIDRNAHECIHRSVAAKYVPFPTADCTIASIQMISY